ncbi:sulfate adenylyltransferase subunit CysN, partial [bacterium]|nr:sulfate adenylyltransferase subunit CysN [bacterium]
QTFEAMLVWMDEKTMVDDTSFFLKHTTQTIRAKIDLIRYQIDVNSLRKNDSKALALNEIGRVTITASRPIFFDPYMKNRDTGSFILIDPVTNFTAAVGMIIDRVASEEPQNDYFKTVSDSGEAVLGVGRVTRSEWEECLGQKSEIIRIVEGAIDEKRVKAFALQRDFFIRGKVAVIIEEKAADSNFDLLLHEHGLIVIIL